LIKVLVSNIVAQIFGKIVLSAIGLFTITILCRYLSVDTFGIYTLAFSIVGFFGPLVEMGMNTIAVRDISQGRIAPASLLTGILLIRLILIVVSIVIIMLVCLAMDYSPELRVLALLASFTLVGTLLGTFEIVLMFLQKMYVLVMAQIISNSALLLSIYSLVKSGAAIQTIVITQVLCAILTYLLMMCVIRHEIKLKKPSYSLMTPFFKASLQQGTSSIIVSYFNNIDMVIISKLVGVGAVAYYGASYRILALMLFVPHAVMISLYPILIKFKSMDEAKFNHVFKYSFYILMLLAISLSTWITCNAEQLVIFVFTDKYLSSVLPLKILVWSGVCTYASYLAGYILVIIHRQKFGIIVSITALIVNVAANLLLIPHYGINGAAFVTIATELCVAMMLYIYIYRHERLMPLSIKLVRVLIAICGTIMLSYLTQNLHVLLAAGVFSIFLLVFIGLFSLGRDREFLQKCSVPV